MTSLRRCVLAAACIFPIWAFAADCSSIKADKARLACYDAGATAQANAAPSKTAPTSAKAGFRSGSWTVDQSVDKMTDKKVCTAIHKGDWKIQGSAQELFISMKGRGGVRGYTVRIDDATAKSLQLATDSEKAISAVNLTPYFDEIYGATRLRVQINSLISGIVVEDIDLNGFKEAIDFIRQNCS